VGLHDIPHDLDRVDRAFGEAVRNLRDWSTPIDVAQLLGVGEVGLHACSRQGFLNFFETWSDLTDGFELNKFSVSVGWADRLIEAGGGLIGAVLDGQHEGDLQHAEPMSLVLGVLQGIVGVCAPKMFFPDELLGSAPPAHHVALSERAYFVNIVVERDAQRWFHQSIAVGMGGACAREITARLARYPLSEQTLAAISRDSTELLHQLVGRVLRQTWGTRWADLDDAESVFMETLAKEVAVSRPLERICQAMEGKYEHLASALNRDLIDDYRKEQRRGRTPDGGTESFTSDHEDRIENPDKGQMTDVETTLWVEGLIKNLTAQGDLRSARLFASFVAQPDLSVKERAHRLGVSERTLLKFRQQLKAHLEKN
jgi:hypothetical protein